MATVDSVLCPPLQGENDLKQKFIISFPFILKQPYKFKRIVNLAAHHYSAKGEENQPFAEQTDSTSEMEERENKITHLEKFEQMFERFLEANPQLSIVSNVPKRFRVRINKIMGHLDISEAGHGNLSVSFFPGNNPKQSPNFKGEVKTIAELKKMRDYYRQILKKAMEEVKSKLKINAISDGIFIQILYIGSLEEINNYKKNVKILMRQYAGNYYEIEQETGEIHLYSKKMHIIMATLPSSRDGVRQFSVSVHHAATLAYCTHILSSYFIPYLKGDQTQAKTISHPLENWTRILVSLNPFIISGRNRANLPILNGLGMKTFINLGKELSIFGKYRTALLDIDLMPDLLDYPNLLKIIFILYRLPLQKSQPLPPLPIINAGQVSDHFKTSIIEHLTKRMNYYLEIVTTYNRIEIKELNKDPSNRLDGFSEEQNPYIIHRITAYQGGDTISNICNALGLKRTDYHNPVKQALNELMKTGVVIGKHMKMPGLHKNDLIYFINIDEAKLREWISMAIDVIMPTDFVTD